MTQCPMTTERHAATESWNNFTWGGTLRWKANCKWVYTKYSHSVKERKCRLGIEKYKARWKERSLEISLTQVSVPLMVMEGGVSWGSLHCSEPQFTTLKTTVITVSASWGSDLNWIHVARGYHVGPKTARFLLFYYSSHPGFHGGSRFMITRSGQDLSTLYTLLHFLNI